MRSLTLYRDAQGNSFVQGTNSAAPAQIPPFTNGETVQIGIDNLLPTATSPRLTAYTETSWGFTSITAALGLIDALPNAGTFCLQVAASGGGVLGTSAPIAWPTDLSTPALVATWKATVLAALIATTSVGAGAVVWEEPANAPANFFYATWTDSTRNDVITAVNVELTPLCLTETSALRDEPAYQQLITIVQAPIFIATDFAFPSALEPVVTDPVIGTVGTNAVQNLALPTNATGALIVGWIGSSAQPMPISGLSAASIATALNGLVSGGATNPSFAVAQVDASNYTVTFIGPLAGAPQAHIAAQIIGAAAPTIAYGKLPVTNPRFTAALNGQPSIPLKFEVCINDSDGAAKIINIVTLQDSMTNATTVVALEQANAVIEQTTTVVVDNSTLTPFFTGNAGANFSPASALTAGATLTVSHSLNSLNVRVWAQYQIQISPPEWVELELGSQFFYKTLTTGTFVCSFGFDLTTGPTDQYYFGRILVFFESPTAVVNILGSQDITWDQCLDTLPSGESVRAKFASIMTALGIFGGALQVPAANITGTLSASQLDLAGLATALQSVSQFLTTLQTLATDATFVNNIAGALSTSNNFVTTLNNLLQNNSTLINTLVTALTNNTAFNTSIQQLIAAILSGTAGALVNTVLWTLPDLNEQYPALPATPNPLPWSPVPKAIFSPTSGGAAPKYLGRPLAAQIGNYYTVGSSGVATALRKKVFVDGDVIFTDGNDWYKAGINGSKYYAAEFDRLLFLLEVTEDELCTGSVFNLIRTFALGFTGNCKAFYRLIVEIGHELDEASDAPPADPADAASFVSDATIIDSKLVLGPAAVTQNVGYSVTCGTKPLFVTDGVTNTDTSLVSASANFGASDVGLVVTGAGIPTNTTIVSVTNTTTVVLSAATTATATGVTVIIRRLTATKQVNLAKNLSTTAPPTARFILRGRLTEMDTEDIPNPAGQFSLTGPHSQTAGIALLS